MSGGVEQFSCIVAEHMCQDALRIAEQMGRDLAQTLLAAGADTVLTIAKQQTEIDVQKQKEDRLKKIAEIEQKEKELSTQSSANGSN